MSEPTPADARLALDQVASELDSTAYRGTYLPTQRLHALADKIRQAMEVLSPGR
ncbi:hypothetical protein [Nocardia xishanensis]|uniref:Uncharacterized protein n=1 Tax=Nocardia xishanensis TaxID=238964 RepID=A0ABW7X724_9NOCA